MLHSIARTWSPAYGRDYKSAAAVLRDFEAGKDFSVGSGGGPYISIRDLEIGEEVSIRYARLTEVTRVRRER